MDEKKKVEKKSCSCRLVGNGIDMDLGSVTLDSDKPLEQYAKQAYRNSAGSLKRLELRGYSIKVTDAGISSSFDLQAFQTKARAA